MSLTSFFVLFVGVHIRYVLLAGKVYHGYVHSMYTTNTYNTRRVHHITIMDDAQVYAMNAHHIPTVPEQLLILTRVYKFF